MFRTRGRRGHHRLPHEAHCGRLHPAAAQLCQPRSYRQGEHTRRALMSSVSWITDNCCLGSFCDIFLNRCLVPCSNLCLGHGFDLCPDCCPRSYRQPWTSAWTWTPSPTGGSWCEHSSLSPGRGIVASQLVGTGAHFSVICYFFYILLLWSNVPLWSPSSVSSRTQQKVTTFVMVISRAAAIMCFGWL